MCDLPVPFRTSCPLSFTFVSTSTVFWSATARRPALGNTKILVSSSPIQQLIDLKFARVRVSETSISSIRLLHPSTRYLDHLGRAIDMPYPMARPDDPVHLKNFDPKTFYPAIAVRGDSLDTSIYPSSSISQAQAQEHHSHAHLPRPELRHRYVLLHPTGPFRPYSTEARQTDVWDSESWLRKQRERNRLRIWMISLCFFVAVGILIAIFAWLGSHHWFQHGGND